jgi:hypothetical protein
MGSSLTSPWNIAAATLEGKPPRRRGLRRSA